MTDRRGPGRPLGTVWGEARERPGGWIQLRNRPSALQRRRRIEEGFSFRILNNVTHVAFIGMPEDVDVGEYL